jgi:hypothetical protein
VEIFARLIKKWSDLSKDWNTDPEHLNKLHNAYHNVFKILREENRLNELEPFINYLDKIISGVVATYYLIHDEELAVKRLEELSKEEGLIGMGSKSNLEQWRKGALHFDF